MSEPTRRAVILAGGRGSRLRPFTFTIPKPLVPIGELPIIEILIRQLVGFGIDRITISVGHLAGLIQAFCGDGGQWGAQIDYLHEDEPLGTIGCLALLDDLDDDRVMVVNGDTLTDMDFRATIEGHDTADAMTISANLRTVDIEFGVLESDESGMLTSYREKPQLSYRVSMGVNVLSRWAIGEFVTGGRLDLPDLVRTIIAADKRVRVREVPAYWLDLGRMADLDAGVSAFEADPGRFLPQ